jgi:hypothetical protein
MTAEAAVAIAAGILARSIALIGFGLDSMIELASAATVIWQLRGEAAGQDRDTRAVRVIAVTFFALAAYLTAESISDLVTGTRPSRARPAWPSQPPLSSSCRRWPSPKEAPARRSAAAP